MDDEPRSSAARDPQLEIRSISILCCTVVALLTSTGALCRSLHVAEFSSPPALATHIIYTIFVVARHHLHDCLGRSIGIACGCWVTTLRVWLRCGLGKRLGEVGDDIVNVFGADGYADEVLQGRVNIC